MALEDEKRRARAQTTVDLLPLPAVMIAAGICIAVNEPYRELMSLRSEPLVGQAVTAMISDRIVPGDQAFVAQANEQSNQEGHLWCRVRDSVGRERAVRVIWRTGVEPDERLAILLDAEPEAFGRDMADVLARATGQLGSCATEGEVLERAADALSAHGLTTTVLLIDRDSPLLRYGPTRSPPDRVPSPAAAAWRDHPPPRSILETFNPGFTERRAAFFQDGVRLVRGAYPEPLALALLAVLPSNRMVQAPLFVDHEPYGALVVTGDPLTPLLAGAIELFAELVARAVENVRSRATRIERERLAALGEAAAVMAHEVRNPVGALLNAASILRRAPQDGVRAQMLEIIAEEAARLERLVEQLLALGRPLTPRFAAVPLAEIRDGALALLERRGELGAVRIERDDADGLVTADADADLMQLAVFNVVQNAVQSSPAGGTLRISLARDGHECVLVVEDAGRGFTEEALRRLSEPFFTTRPAGTGMGLALVRRVLDAHAGRIDVRRSEVLGGARVELRMRAART